MNRFFEPGLKNRAGIRTTTHLPLFSSEKASYPSDVGLWSYFCNTGKDPIEIVSKA
jgi:hypothetical protein